MLKLTYNYLEMHELKKMYTKTKRTRDCVHGKYIRVFNSSGVDINISDT